MNIKIVLQLILRAFFPSLFFRNQNKKEEIICNKYVKEVEKAISSQTITKEEVLSLNTLLGLQLVSLQLRLNIQATPIMGATEEILDETIIIGENYIKSIVKLRGHFPKYFPDWTKRVESGEIPASIISPT